MKLSIKDIRAIFYGFCIFCYVLLQSQLINLSNVIETILKSCVILSIVIMFIIKIKNNFKISFGLLLRIIIFSAMILWFIIVNNSSSNLLILLMLIILVDGIPIDKIMKSYSYATLISLGLVIILWLLNVLPNIVDLKNRYYLGFNYTTFSANIFFSFVLSYVAYKKEKLNFIYIILILLFNYYLFIKTDTIAVYLSILACIVIVFLLKSNRFKMIFDNQLLKKIIVALPFILAIFSIGIQLYYNAIGYTQPAFIKIDRLLSYRLTLGKQAFSMYNVGLFGQEIFWNTSVAYGDYFFLDSSYIRILLSYGIIMLIIVCAMMSRILRYNLERKNLYMTIVLIVFLVHCVTDPQLLTYGYNPFIVLFITIFMEEKNTKYKKIN